MLLVRDTHGRNRFFCAVNFGNRKIWQKTVPRYVPYTKDEEIGFDTEGTTTMHTLVADLSIFSFTANQEPPPDLMAAKRLLLRSNLGRMLTQDASCTPADQRKRRNVAMSADEAKDRFMARLAQLDRLCRRQFPGNELLALEASQFVIDQLEKDDWSRIRAWPGKGAFGAFYHVVVKRLATDYWRIKFGHTLRKPAYLANQSDQLWHQAFQLLVIEKYDRREVVEMLVSVEPERSRGAIELAVQGVIANNRKNVMSKEPLTSLNTEPEGEAVQAVTADRLLPGPLEQLEVNEDELLQAIVSLLTESTEGDCSTQSASPDNRVAALSARLAATVRLNAEDRLFLRLLHVEGLSMQQVRQRLGLTGDLYKRRIRILEPVRRAFEELGLIP